MISQRAEPSSFVDSLHGQDVGDVALELPLRVHGARFALDLWGRSSAFHRMLLVNFFPRCQAQITFDVTDAARAARRKLRAKCSPFHSPAQREPGPGRGWWLGGLSHPQPSEHACFCRRCWPKC